VNRRSVARGDAGFTLIELLIVVVIEALIVGALGSAFVLLMNNSKTVKESLARSADARLAAGYIVGDASNSSGPETSLSDTTSCPDAGPPVAGAATAVVRFNWNSTSSSGTTTANIANYVLVSNSLLRRFCQNGSLVTDEVLASNVTSANAACSPNANCSGTPTTITATITETAGSNGGTPYQYSLTGAFRKALYVGAVLPPGPTNPYSLVALGAGGCSAGATGVKTSGATSVVVHGAAYLNTADGSTCTAMSLNNGSFSADTTKILTGGSCSNSGSSVCPATTAYSPAIADPYAGVTAPSTSGMTAQSGCPGGIAQPGVYAAALSITGSATCQLASGIYILQNGLDVANSGILTNAAGGVLVYVTGGSVSFGGAAQVTLSAMTSGSYSGMALWQAATDTNTMSISNSATVSVTGAIYTPAAQLSVGGSTHPTVDQVVVQVLVMSSSGQITIGTASTPLSITTASLPAWTVNRPYTTTVAGAGGDGSYLWSAGGLPAGLTIASGTGVISGTPTAAGAPNVTITLNDASGDTPASAGLTLTINAAPSITTSSPLPSATKSSAYSTTIAGAGGTTGYSWSATGLPAGLTIGAGTGTISGTPTTAGTSSVGVTLTDAAGATATKNLSLTVNAGSGPLISSVSLTNNGSTPGKLEKSDTIDVTFSTPMSVSSFCTAWSGDGSDQSLNSNGNVTVTVHDGVGATNDSISVTSASCTFNFGSIDLGSNAYTSGGDSTFSGNGSNKSTITWTASTHTLSITLGRASGTLGTVASSAPSYAAGSITDSGGAAVANSPFTLANATQF
jgi:prepilin-type N-terminal cleavage/methylation domain-containing protein